MEIKTVKNNVFTFLKDGGEIGQLISMHDWDSTPLGDPDSWSPSLRSSVSILINSRFPMLLLWGPQFICIYNDPFKVAFRDQGKHPSAIGKRCFEVWPDRSHHIEPLMSAAMAGEHIPLQSDTSGSLFLNRQNGHTPWNYSFAQVYGDRGEVAGLLITCCEETGRPQRDNLLGTDLENLLEQAPVGVMLLTGPEMRVNVVNRACARLVGRNVDELEGKNIFDLFPDAEPKFRPMLEQVRAAGERFILRDHPYAVSEHNRVIEKFLNLTYEPYRDRNGMTIGVLVICQDNTQEVETRKMIERAEAKARLAIDSASLGTYELDLVTNELITSARFNAIWGVDRQLGRHELVSFIHPEDLPIREKAHMEGRKSGLIFYEVRIRHSDNSEHWVRVNGKIFRDADGEPRKLFGIVQDITEAKQFTEELARQVRLRTEETRALNDELIATNQGLSQANEQLTYANRELEQYAYVASHDLQEPLRKIQTFTSMLSDRYASELSQDAATILSKISASSERMSSLIRDLLDYTRLINNKPLYQPVDLNLILQNVLSDFEFSIRQRDVLVEADQLPTIEAIPIQMNQLFYNLVGNALKFARKGVRLRIRISARKLSPEETLKHGLTTPSDAYTEITVSDNGIGFSQQYAEQIFRMFQRLNDRSVYGGYGIGLALCRRIVLNHNGTIFAQGRENEGASFVVVLPETH